MYIKLSKVTIKTFILGKKIFQTSVVLLNFLSKDPQKYVSQFPQKIISSTIKLFMKMAAEKSQE